MNERHDRERLPALLAGIVGGIDPRLMGELLGLLSHDLRNPLAAFHSNLEYLISALGDVDEEAREALSDGKVSCDGLSHIIDNIDLLGQVLRSAKHRSSGPCPLSAVLLAAVKRCGGMAESHGVLLEHDPEVPRLHAVLEGPREMLVIALTNLIRNSIQHAPGATTVHVSASVQPGSVEVLVADRGLPVPASLRDVAFSAVGQVESKTQSNCRYSRGLGLFCARVAACLCGGSIEANGDDGVQGSTFRLILPAASFEKQKPAASGD